MPEYESKDRGEFGLLVRGALELRAMVQEGLTLRPEDIPADEWNVLRLLREEEPQDRPTDNS